MKRIVYLILTIAFVNMAYCQNVDDLCSREPHGDDREIYDAYRYASFGVGPIIFIPNVGIGYRERYSYVGWDAALSFSTIGYAHQLSGHLVGHYYLSPCKKNSMYLGLGLLASGVVTNHDGCGGTISPDFVFGKEFARDAENHFIEMHVAIPTFLLDRKRSSMMYLPLMYIKYGISF